jgi:hypothetical protein
MIEDYSHTLLEQEEMHFYSCVADVVEAFQTHGAINVLKEAMKNPQLNQELSVLFSSNIRP